MLLQFVNIMYVLIAVAIIAIVLLQQGSGAQAGSGFGGGASSTVFGARGASTFLSKSTKWLTVAFFVISMGLAMYATRGGANRTDSAKADLGVMAQQTPAKADAPVPEVQVPTAPAQPAVVAPAVAAPAAAQPTATQAEQGAKPAPEAAKSN